MRGQRSRLTPLAGTAALLGVLAAPAIAADSADAARIQELEKKLERSMQLIDELASKVKQLEQGGGKAAVAADDAKQNAQLGDLQRQVTDLMAANSRRGGDDGLAVHGFLDVTAGKSRENNADFGKGNKGFTVGAFDLYLTPQLGQRVRSLVELIFEVNEEGETTADLERAQIGYTFSDALTAWGGRFHTPFGYWNTAFHHGAQIQTAVSRPRFLAFEDEGGILPDHTTGLWLTGNTPLAGGRFGYDFYTGNAPRIAGAFGQGVLDIKMGGETQHIPSNGFKLSYSPSAIPDLVVGAHGLRAKVNDESANETRLNMIGGYSVFNNDNWEVMGEYYRFRNHDLSGNTGAHHSSAWYAQAGYTIGMWTPYARVERTKLDQTDNYFLAQQNGRSYRLAALGLRYELDPKAVVKFELDRTRKNDLAGGLHDSFSEARLQYAIRF